MFLVMICSLCRVELSQYRDGKRHDLWLDLEHVDTGKIHLAITVLEKQNESLSSDKTSSNSTTFEVWSISTSHVYHIGLNCLAYDLPTLGLLHLLRLYLGALS